MKRINSYIILFLLGVLIVIPIFHSIANYKFSISIESKVNSESSILKSSLDNFLENYFEYLLLLDTNESEQESDNLDIEEGIDDFHQPIETNFKLTNFTLSNVSLLLYNEHYTLMFLPETTPPPPKFI